LDWLVFLGLLGAACLVWWSIRRRNRRADAAAEENPPTSQEHITVEAIDVSRRGPWDKRDIPTVVPAALPDPGLIAIMSEEAAAPKPRRRRKQSTPEASERLLFLDVETTGLSRDDRIVSIGMVSVLAGDLINHAGSDGYELAAKTMHLVFNPQRPSNPFAQRVHGWSDEVLARQNPFEAHASSVVEFLRRSDVWIAHNLAFDLRFVRQELRRLSLPVPRRSTFCTMEQAKVVWEGETAKLDQCVRRIGLARAGKRHGALEDALLCAALYTHYQLGKTFRGIPECGQPTNLR